MDNQPLLNPQADMSWLDQVRVDAARAATRRLREFRETQADVLANSKSQLPARENVTLRDGADQEANEDPATLRNKPASEVKAENFAEKEALNKNQPSKAENPEQAKAQVHLKQPEKADNETSANTKTSTKKEGK